MHDILVGLSLGFGLVAYVVLGFFALVWMESRLTQTPFRVTLHRWTKKADHHTHTSTGLGALALLWPLVLAFYPVLAKRLRK